MPVARLTETEDWERASAVVADAYFPHELRLLGGAAGPRLSLHTVDLGAVLIGHVGWGADVAIACDYPAAYEVNMPVTGHLESRGRHGGSVVSVPGQGAVFRADTPSLIERWDATCHVVGVKFRSGWLDAEAERVLGPGSVARSGLRTVLPERLDVDAGAGRQWRQLVGALAAQASEPGALLANELVRTQLAGALTAGFLLAAFPEGPTVAARPRTVSRVLDRLHDDPGHPWTAGEMAEVAGVSVRRLQEGFRQWVGETPGQVLTRVRLERGHDDLVAGRGTVSDVAARWGFSSASRFAAAYRRRYGVTPASVRRR